MSLLTVVAIYLLKLMIILMVHGPLQQCPLLCYATSLARCASSLAGKMAAAPPPRHTVFFFGNFGSEIQIGNEQVWGKNWIEKVVINKFSVGKKLKNGPKFHI